MPQFEIYILRAAHALGCARFFCYQVICRFFILNESELSMAKQTSCITLTSRYKVLSFADVQTFLLSD